MYLSDRFACIREFTLEQFNSITICDCNNQHVCPTYFIWHTMYAISFLGLSDEKEKDKFASWSTMFTYCGLTAFPGQ